MIRKIFTLLLCCMAAAVGAQPTGTPPKGTAPKGTQPKASPSKSTQAKSAESKAAEVKKVRARIIFQVNAGSRAPWGTDQDLTIDSMGGCEYRLSEVYDGVKDSLRFSLPAGYVDSLLRRSDELGFFKLDSDYVRGRDGSGVYISMNYHGRIYSVNVINKDIPQIHSIVSLLNGLLQPHKISIKYPNQPVIHPTTKNK